MTTFLDHALRLAELGYPVFQCIPRGKLPFGGTAPNGCNSATRDARKIRRWWRQTPDCNIGIKCERCLILDLDDKDGRNGTQDFNAISTELGHLPDSPIAQTPTGGWHLYFAKPNADIVGKVGALWKNEPTGIDIRTGNQYVLAPPSQRENGAYSWRTEIITINDLPHFPQRWINEFLPQRRAENPVLPIIAGPTDHEMIERCRRYVATMDAAISGQEGHPQTIRVANVIFHGFALDEADGWSILLDYNSRCQPPWSIRELTHKMNEAIEHPPDNSIRGALRDRFLQQQTVYSDVDISGLIRAPTIIVPPIPETEPHDLTPIPESFLHVPGYVEQVMNHCLNSSPYPSTQLAFCGAMALQSFLCSRKITEPGGIRPNLYLLAIGGSGHGKGWPRKINSYILQQIGLGNCAGNQISSGQGLEDAMFVNRKMLFQSDEFDNILRTLASTKDPNYMYLLSMLLQLYSEGDETHQIRVKAGQQKSLSIDQPGLVIFGTATPTHFFKAMTPDVITNGLFSRTLILDVAERGRHQRAHDYHDMPPELIEHARNWVEFKPPGSENRTNLDDEHPDPYKIPITDDANTIFDELGIFADDQYDAGFKKNDDVHMNAYTRTFENAMRLALVRAASQSVEQPVIDAQTATWAAELAKLLSDRMHQLAKKNVADNPFHAECLKVKKFLNAAKGKKLLHVDLLRKMKIPLRNFREIVDTIREQGEITILPAESGRGMIYKLIE